MEIYYTTSRTDIEDTHLKSIKQILVLELMVLRYVEEQAAL